MGFFNTLTLASLCASGVLLIINNIQFLQLVYWLLNNLESNHSPSKEIKPD